MPRLGSAREKGGHTETRRLWFNLADAQYLREHLNVPGCQIVLRADREVRAADGTVLLHDSRYFVTSRDPGTISPSQLHSYIRGHWQVGNCLHFLKDRW